MPASKCIRGLVQCYFYDVNEHLWKKKRVIMEQLLMNMQQLQPNRLLSVAADM